MDCPGLAGHEGREHGRIFNTSTGQFRRRVHLFYGRHPHWHIGGGQIMTDRQQAVAYAIIALVIGIIIALGMLNYSQRQDARLFATEANGAWTMPNLKAEGWQQKRDDNGNIYYTQNRYVLEVK